MSKPSFEQADLDQLHENITNLIKDGYVEQNRYIYVMPEFLKVGIPQFNQDLSLTRRWADRLLSMLEDARRYYASVETELEPATKKRLEYAVVQYLSDPSTTVPKKLDAGQRETWSRSHFGDLETEHDRWVGLKAGLKAFIDTTDKRFKHLLNAKNDLRSQLWAIRLHGIIGDLPHELHQEGKELEDESLPPYRRTPEVGQNAEIVVNYVVPTAPTAHLSLSELPLPKPKP